MFRILTRLFERFTTSRILSKKNLRQLEKILSHRIKNQDYYIQAFTHRSALDDKKFKISNERLEFLGDSLIGFIIATELFENFQNKDEGFLTKARANFVNKNSLYDAAIRIDLIHFLNMNQELIGASSVGMKTVLADAFEALVGAIYLDLGMDVTKNFINKYLFAPNLKLGLHLTDENYKSQLLEYTQAVKIETPRYFVVREEGPEHDRIFTVQARVENNVYGEGRGRNKKSAEQQAAKDALQKLKELVAQE